MEEKPEESKTMREHKITTQSQKNLKNRTYASPKKRIKVAMAEFSKSLKIHSKNEIHWEYQMSL